MTAAALLLLACVACGRYPGYDDTEFGQNLPESGSDVLSSEHAKKMPSSGRQYIALMDSLSKEYAVCSVYFALASSYAERDGAVIDGVELSLSHQEYEELRRAAWALLEMTTNVGRSDDTYMRIAVNRHNMASRNTFGRNDHGPRKRWSEAVETYDAHCRLLTENVPLEISPVIGRMGINAADDLSRGD